MNTLKKIVPLIGLSLGASLAGGRELPVLKTALNTHPEFPHAVGALAPCENGWRIDYDFFEGGHGVGMTVTPKAPFWAEAITFEALHAETHRMQVIVCDATGQFLRKVAPSAPGAWHPFRCDLRHGWIGHWGGANDGRVHQPIRSLEISLQRLSLGVTGKVERGSTFIRNLGYDEAKREDWERPDAPGVRYLVTDFRPGDVFSGGPRAFFRTDLREAIADGDLTIDFARFSSVSLVCEIPIWGRTKELLFSVEAEAAAAGLSFDLICRTGKGEEVHPCGTLRAAAPHESRLYQTFSLPGFPSTGRNRLMRLAIRRGKAPARALRVRPIRLEAVVAADFDLPPLIALPPTGATPPKTMTVGFLNLTGEGGGRGATALPAWAGGGGTPPLPAGSCGGRGATTALPRKVRVSLTDWEGRALGAAEAPLPSTKPGERGFATVSLPAVPDNLNFVSYRCELVRSGRPDMTAAPWTTSWTRPLADAGSPEKNPDSPWGFGVYMHRTDGLFAFDSAYATPTNAAADGLMERRAALAQAAGIKWERCEFKPGQINFAKGRYDFSLWDRLLAIADRHGISCLGLWSHYFPPYDKPYTQPCYDDYIATLGVAARRYQGRIAHWEIWNEPNISFWTGPKEDYPRLVDSAWETLKKVDPSHRVMAFSMAGLGLDFIDMCIGKGVKFDEIAIHPYRAAPNEELFLADLASVTNRSRGTRLFLTEMGWPTGCGPNTYSEIEQAAYYARAYMTAAGSGMVHSIYGYNFVDDGFNVQERENNFGILRRDLTPKPAYRAIAQVCRTFVHGKATIEKVVPCGGQGLTALPIKAWVFRMDGKTALWADRPVALDVHLAKPCRAVNLMGEAVGPAASRFPALAVGPLRPVFLDGPVLRVDVSATPLATPTRANTQVTW